jgi:hypothetical protein
MAILEANSSLFTLRSCKLYIQGSSPLAPLSMRPMYEVTSIALNLEQLLNHGYMPIR